MIKTARLSLVGFDMAYQEELFDLWSDFEVIKYTYTPLITSIDNCAKLIQHQINRTDKDFPDRFVILLDNRAIGIAGCVCMDKENQVFGLYYQIARKHWGNGYATEAAKAIVDYVPNAYPAATIKAEAVSVNPASLAVLKKLGFRQTHIEEKGFKRNGVELYLVHFSYV